MKAMGLTALKYSFNHLLKLFIPGEGLLLLPTSNREYYRDRDILGLRYRSLLDKFHSPKNHKPGSVGWILKASGVLGL